MGAPSGRQRFEHDPHAYASYLTTVDGRLRVDLAWANLCEFLPSVESGDGPPRALDVGGGPGDMAVRLALCGWEVTLLDGAQGMLDLASKAAREAHVAGRVHCLRADVMAMPPELSPGSFGVVLCHNVLEYVADPDRVLGAIGRLAHADGLVSILVRNRFGEAMKAAIKSFDLDQAELALEAEWVSEPLYGEPALLFDRASLAQRVSRAGLSIIGELGVRVVSDYLPESATQAPEDYDRVMAFDQTLGATPELVDVARYIQVIAVPATLRQST